MEFGGEKPAKSAALQKLICSSKVKDRNHHAARDPQYKKTKEVGSAEHTGHRDTRLGVFREPSTRKACRVLSM